METEPRDEDLEQEEGTERQEPDEGAGPAVEPVQGDQGEYVEQMPAGANPGDVGFDPDVPRRTSPPDPSQQEGVARHMTGGGNEDVPEGGGDPEERPTGDAQTGDE